MKKKVAKKNNSVWWQETIDTPETEYVEENFYVEESLVKNKELIRMEMNLIQLPIFSKNTKRKVNQVVKYFFNRNRDTYVTVTPTAGNYIPGEMEEKIFIALMQIMKEKGMPRQFIISGTELRDRLKINTTRYGDIIKSSLLRLSETNYKFKNTMYSSELKGVISKEVSTPILTLEIITLSLRQNQEYRRMFDDKRIKEVYKITITDHFYNNIIQKGYMVYNSRILLDISTSTARTIYMIIEKMRFEKIELRIDTIFLIKRIPLKFDKNHLSQTVKTLQKALEELKDKNLIKDFNIIKETVWEKSEIEIIFYEESNNDKQQRFYEDRNDFRKLLTSTSISGTEHEMIEEIEAVDTHKEVVVTVDMIQDVLKSMPKKASELKTMPKTIKDAIEQYGYDKVESVAKYMKKNKVEKVRAYFLKALEQNWVQDEELIPKIDIKQNEVLLTEDVQDIKPKYDESLFDVFEKLSEDKKNDIEFRVYKKYTDECGMDTKIQKIAFAGSRKKYICEFLEKYPEFLKSEDVKQVVQEYTDDVEEELGIEKIKELILESIEMASIVYSYSDAEKKDAALKIIRQALPLKNKGGLTLDKLNELISENLNI